MLTTAIMEEIKRISVNKTQEEAMKRNLTHLFEQLTDDVFAEGIGENVKKGLKDAEATLNEIKNAQERATRFLGLMQKTEQCLKVSEKADEIIKLTSNLLNVYTEFLTKRFNINDTKILASAIQAVSFTVWAYINPTSNPEKISNNDFK
jgi:hypothetical protein